MRTRTSIVGLLAVLLLGGCELFDTREDAAEGIDYGSIREIVFSRHVQPLLAQKCTGCHAGPDAAAGLRLDTWERMIAGSDFGEALIPFDAENSLLVGLATKLRPAHPAALGADTLSAEEAEFLARWIDEGARNDAGTVPYEDAENLLYVANQDDATISVIDMQANVVIRTVRLADFGFTASPRPHHIDVAPDGEHWYVSLIGGNAVLKFDPANTLVGQTPFIETPGLVAVHPSGSRIYAGRSLSAVDPPRSIAVIGAEDLAVEEVGVFFEKPHALAVLPNGQYLVAASLVTNQLAVIDAVTNEVTLNGVAGPPQAFLHMAFSPDSQTMYLTGQLAGQLKILDLAEPTRPTLVATLDAGAAPWHPVVTPDGAQVYFGNKAANTVTVVDTGTRSIAAVIAGEGLARPHGAAVRPDGRYVYVSNNNTPGATGQRAYTPRYALGDNARHGTVVVIDTATNEIVKVLEVGLLPTGLGATR